MNLIFKRNSYSGNLYCRYRGHGLSVYRAKDNTYQWKIRMPGGQDRFSERGFATEREALDDITDAFVEQMIVHKMLTEEDADDFA